MAFNQSRTYTPCYDDLTLGGTVLEYVRNLRILGITFDSKLTFETHLREVVSKTARNFDIVRQAGKLFDCPRVLKSCSNAYVLSNLEYSALVWISYAESYLILLDRVVRNAGRLCDSERCCLEHRKRASDYYLLYKIYRRANHSLHEYLHHFVAARNTKASTVLGELALGTPRRRSDQFSRSFLPAAVRL